MKKIISLFLTVLLSFSLISCTQKKVNNPKIEIGESIIFSEEEINSAVEIVKDNFAFPASTLKRIWYEEEKSNDLLKSYMEHGNGLENGIIPENVIVLLSNFDVDGSGDNPVLNRNTTYENYQWILIRDNESSDWTIDDFGF